MTSLTTNLSFSNKEDGLQEKSKASRSYVSKAGDFIFGTIQRTQKGSILYHGKKATEPIKNGNPKKPGFSKKIQIKLEASIDSFQKSRSKTEIKAHSKQHFQRLPITFRKQQKES